MSELPTSWAEATLGELIHGIESGKNIKCIERPPSESERGIVKISAVTWGTFQEGESKTVPSHVEVDERARIERGDLLLSRANTLELVGAAVRVEDISKRLYLSDKVLRLKGDLGVLPWLHRALTSPAIRKAISNASSGNQLSMRNISQGALRALSIPVAPLKEQQRIIPKLERLLSKADACRARLERVPKILKQFREAALEAAVSGKLTEEWRRQNHLDLSSWRDVAVGDVVGALNGRAFPSAAYSGSGVRLLRPGNLHSSGYVDWTPKNTANLPDQYAEKFPAYLIVEGDLIMNLTAQSLKDNFLGRVCLMRGGGAALLNQRICVYRPISNDDVRPFLHVYFRSPLFRRYVDTLDSGTLIKHMYTKQVLEHRLRIPTSSEQAEIVRRTSQLLELADAAQRRQESALGTLQRLGPSVLAKAFRGELAPQDPTDEPASVLLEQIRKGRERELGERGQETRNAGSAKTTAVLDRHTDSQCIEHKARPRYNQRRPATSRSRAKPRAVE